MSGFDPARTRGRVPDADVVVGNVTDLSPFPELFEELDEKLAHDPCSRSCGEHIIGVLRVS
ncbi:MAG: hypothetical protein WAL31_06925 [Gaiellaceae bacterium]